MKVEWGERRVVLHGLGGQMGYTECACCKKEAFVLCVNDVAYAHEHWCTDCIPPEVLVIAALEGTI